MKIVIWKYEADKNFFALPALVDKMILTEIYSPGFPLYNEELTSDEDQLVYKAGDWDIKFSLLQTTLSSGGKNLKSFFFDGNYKFLVGCTFTNLIGSWKWGFVRADGILCDETISQNRFEINLSTYGALKEWADYYSARPADSVNSDGVTFDQYFENFLFGPGKVQNLLAIESKAGFMPVVSRPLQNGFISLNNPIITAWEAFKEIAKCLGFLFKIVNPLITYPLEGYDHPPFQIQMFWASESLGNEEVEVIEHKEGFELMGLNDYVAVPFYHAVWTGQSESFYDSYGGFCMDKNKYAIFNPRGMGLSEIIANEPTPSFNIPTDGKNISIYSKDSFFFYNQSYSNPKTLTKLKNVNVKLYNTILVVIGDYKFKFAYARMFVNRVNQYDPNQHIYLDEGFADIINNTARTEYRYLISGLKRFYELKTRYALNSTLTVNSHASLPNNWGKNPVNARCLKVRDIDLLKETANTYWVEI